MADGTIFLSYADADRKWADALAAGLTKQGLDVWYDAKRLLPGDNWGLVSGQALENASTLLVLLSPEAAESSKVRSEIQFALGSLRYKDRVISVELSPGGDVPWILREFKFIRATTPSETVREILLALDLEKTHSS